MDIKDPDETIHIKTDTIKPQKRLNRKGNNKSYITTNKKSTK